MTRIFTQSDNKSLNTEARITIEFNPDSRSSNVFVTSKKILENPDFNKPLNELKK